MKKAFLILLFMTILGGGVFLGMNLWQENTYNKALEKIDSPEKLSYFLEKILPQEAQGKIKIQTKDDKNILVAIFKLEYRRNPSQVISKYLVWAKRAIVRNKLEIDSVRIFVYFEKEKEQYYVIVGRNEFSRIKGNLVELDDCKKISPLDINNFCIKSINL